MAIQATAIVGSAALVHPAFIDPADADNVVAPICVLASKDEDPKAMKGLIDAVKKKPFGDKVFFKTFHDMFHGWCAGRANYGDELNNKRAHEVFDPPNPSQENAS